MLLLMIWLWSETNDNCYKCYSITSLLTAVLILYERCLLQLQENWSHTRYILSIFCSLRIKVAVAAHSFPVMTRSWAIISVCYKGFFICPVNENFPKTLSITKLKFVKKSVIYLLLDLTKQNTEIKKKNFRLLSQYTLHSIMKN